MRADRGARWLNLLAKGAVAVVMALSAIAFTHAAADAAPQAAPAGNIAACRNQTSSLARLACLSAATAPAPAPPKRTGPPAGARAVCRDNTYSFSTNRWTACRYHGGVRSWLG